MSDTEQTLSEKISELIIDNVILRTDDGQPYVAYDDQAVDALLTAFADYLKAGRLPEQYGNPSWNGYNEALAEQFSAYLKGLK